jgi:formylglycine-generating enzyme required for sulfatase activity
MSFARMHLAVFAVGVAALIGSLAVPAHAVTIDMVLVGDAGNANDTGGNGIGRVDYEYQIGTYDVTIGQYAAFLNAADPNGTNPNDIYNVSMATDLNIAGILYTAEANAGAKYSVINNGGDSGNRPITYVSWFDAARFCNWMTNGQGSGSTETGAYTLSGATSGDAVAANPGAAFRLPTENEWYKAAYYATNYGAVGLFPGSPGYYEYATQSDFSPVNVSGTFGNHANYIDGVYSVTQVSTYDPNQNYLTDVGAFSGSRSFYGTFDQSGNVWQWNDLDGTAGSTRGFRGGSWNESFLPSLSSSSSGALTPSDERYFIGFRLASPVAVPEPSTYAMAVAGLACGGYTMFRRRKRA